MITKLKTSLTYRILAAVALAVLYFSAVGLFSYYQTLTVQAVSPNNPRRACEVAWGGTGASNVLQSGDDSIANNSCFNKLTVTDTIIAVYCMSDVSSNTVTINPTFGATGTGTTILSGALTCGSSNAYSSTGTVSNAALTDGSGISPGMGGTLNAHSIHMLVVYTVPAQ